MLKNPAFYKFLLVFIVSITVLVVTANLINRAIHRDYWHQQELATRAAYEQSEIVKVNHVEAFTYEHSYMIVFGQDEAGEDMIVWVAMDPQEIDDESVAMNPQEMDEKSGVGEGWPSSGGPQVVHSAYADEGFNKNLLRLTLRETMPDIHIIRMTPGKYMDEWAWEVLYKVSAKEARTYYGYYRFTDGAHLQTLTMSLK